ncbi:nucleotidyl transferase AbiEii/AbiGii toxin family protein [Luteolibacter sp. GHJ8]|uniref:Nucleotidyl transferase AbiEii/AbiGii toxin family protein n=1 Tax=Luteolibacter rhizosphaerae TaxID=2989719 RepID=A0ABT3G8V7_9BACT|nr:nucleotidyl transferase AbiEii/AbiGii toxin family protein [Luteolibacter rhizosphaerae]MCW1916283.1 nucleotidyl transferase AbiEii/AbiGii toxin family protein [Luteolibacter rhizosphaerae]
MGPDQQRAWKDSVLQEVLQAIARQLELRRVIIFKGARILNLHLGTTRQSLDIDSNLDADFHESMSGPEEEAAWFQEHLLTALHRHFEDQDPVRFTLDSVAVRRNPPRFPHPRGWDMLVAEIRLTDERFRGVRGLPVLELEIAAPEPLGPHAVCELAIDGASIQAYTLHRIAGEKLRAFLTSLPAYRQKMSGGERAMRVKDLHDLSRILNARPISDHRFWSAAAAEFRLACESRRVDCEGPVTFKQNPELIRRAYEGDASLSAIPWEEAEQALDQVLAFLAEQGTFPLHFPA